MLMIMLMIYLIEFRPSMLNYIIAYDSHLCCFSVILFFRVHIEKSKTNPKIFIADAA